MLHRSRALWAVFTMALLVPAVLAAGCSSDNNSADAAPMPDAPPPTGTVSLSWHLTQGGADVTCADAGATLVTLELVREGQGAGEADTANCSAGMVTTHEIHTGTYEVTLDLINSGGSSLLASPVVQDGVEVTSQSDTPLGDVEFQLPSP